MKIALVLLAAGLSRRFGGNKLLYPVDGVPMAERALRLHSGLPYAERVLVTQEGYRELQTLARELGYAVAVNPEPERGLGSSVRCGVDALLSAGEAPDAALFAVADQPYLRRETVQRLLDAYAASPGRIAVLASGTHKGNPAIFPHALFAELRALPGDRGGTVVMRAHPELVTLHDFAEERELTDVDHK